MKLSSSYLLVAHGSRDPQFESNLQKLAQSIRQQLENKVALSNLKNNKQSNGKNQEKLATNIPQNNQVFTGLVETACLELAPLPLHKSIEQFARIVCQARWQKLEILPLFLAPGVHVNEDIPAEVAKAQQQLGSALSLELLPHLGSNWQLSKLLDKQFASLAADARILLAHGSRRASANQTVEARALELNAIAAYWSVSPQLLERIEELILQGKKKIAIVPYFLFSGSITDAIAQQVKQLQETFPNTELVIGQPLGATTELAKIIIEGVA
ncbi:MAG: sirohydrochlorin chelatase [Xenococcaceae cyanobacterium]